MSVNGKNITTVEDAIANVSANSPVFANVRRDNEEMQVQIIPQNGKIGTQISYEHIDVNKNFSRQLGLIDAIKMGASETYYSSIMTFTLVKKTFSSLLFPKTETERVEAQNNLSGPIGAGNAFVMMVEHSVPVQIIILFVALLSINLAVMNILPFPALDGGRMALTTLYSVGKIIGLPKEKILKLEGFINSIGFILLLIFMLYVAGLDIFRLFR